MDVDIYVDVTVNRNNLEILLSLSVSVQRSTRAENNARVGRALNQEHHHKATSAERHSFEQTGMKWTS